MSADRENEMKDSNEIFDQARDPLGLRKLDMTEPGYDGWPEIRTELERQPHSFARRVAPWAALAASVLLAVTIGIRLPSEGPVQVDTDQGFAEISTNQGSDLESLISLSQTVEARLGELRGMSGAMPAESAIYVAELQDLVAQVDAELSYSPDSVHLWGQRVNLLLDLAQIYQHQWELDYGKMASL